MKRIQALWVLPLLLGLAADASFASPVNYRYPGQSATGSSSVRSIVVESTQPQLDVGLRLNRSGANPFYRVGDPISMTVTTTRDAYVYLFSIEADGQIKLILPNRFDGQQNWLRAGEVLTLPPTNASYRFTVTDPVGQAQVVAVASQQPLSIDEIDYFTQGGALFDNRTRLSASRSASTGSVSRAIVVEEVPQQPWVSARVSYRVAGWR